MKAWLVGVCLQLVQSPQVPPHFIETHAFTLAWTHTIEKVRWEEDYQVSYSGMPVLHAVAARIKGSAAGMEPPSDAVLKDGWYHYTPRDATPLYLALTRSEFSADYQWCDNSGCVPFSAKMPKDGGVTLVTACVQPN